MQLDPSGGGSTTVPTDANGMAVLGKMGQDISALIYGSGTFRVTASVNGGDSKTFSLVVS